MWKNNEHGLDLGSGLTYNVEPRDFVSGKDSLFSKEMHNR